MLHEVAFDTPVCSLRRGRLGMTSIWILDSGFWIAGFRISIFAKSVPAIDTMTLCCQKAIIYTTYQSGAIDDIVWDHTAL